jgi:NodT family efflux transporter outer membrane factor (OMF) lipoprotein
MMPRMKQLTYPLVGALVLMLSSCMVGPNYQTPKAEVESQWVESIAVAKRPAGSSDPFWWKKLKDPVLNHLIEIAIKNNPTLQMAGVSILGARAQLNHAIGNLFPQSQGVSGGSSWYYLPPQSGGGNSSTQFQPGTPLGQAFSQQLSNNLNSGGSQMGPNLYLSQFLFNSSWEIDFWGKYRRQVQADKASYLSSVASYDSALVTLIGDVATSYINIRTTQELIRVTQENIALQTESLRIATERFKAGQVSQQDPEQSQTELSQTQSQIPTLQNTLQQAKNGLALQLGLTPAAVEPLLKQGRLPSPPEKIVAGIPVDLLRRRPDVRMAGLNAASQSALIGVQVANILPAFSLNGTFGYANQGNNNYSLGNIFNWQNAIVSSGGSFTMPIFNYMRLVNNVRVQNANFQSAVLNYQNTVLNAQKEVENGLSQFSYGKQGVVFLENAVKSSKTSTDLSLYRYKCGQTDYTTVLTAEQQLMSVESSLVSTRGNVLLGLVSAYRALGGGWQLREGGDVISAEVKKEMEKTFWWGQMMKPARHLPSVAPEDRPVREPKGCPSLPNLLNVNTNS